MQTPTIYFLEDLQGESIKGTFYREELIPTTPVVLNWGFPDHKGSVTIE